jgi:iron complex transport system substrate-binding protein
MTRRQPVRRLLLPALVLSLALAACGGDDSDSSSGAASADTGDDSAFPVTIDHVYGSTEIPERPERVVSVGFNEQDILYALGVTPVAVREWFGEKPHATWSWAEDELGDGEPVVLSADELNFEQIAELRPDLIVGVYSGITDDEYETLSAIAPTLPESGEYIDYGTPWQEMTTTVGRAVGEEARAEEIVAEVEGELAAAREEHPEFEGATAVVGTAFETEIYAYAAQDPRGRFLAELGFEVPAEIDELAGDEFTATVSPERVDLFDADVLIWITDGDQEIIENDPLFQGLRAATEGRVIFVDNLADVGGALSFQTALSLPFLLDELVPQMATAVDGDPATT